MTRPLLAGLALLGACSRSTPIDGPTDTPVWTGDTGVRPTVDCAAIPAVPEAPVQLDRPRGYHDVAFDRKGNILGSDGLALLAFGYDGALDVLFPSPGVVHGMDWLPSGELVYANEIGTVMRLGTAGAASLLASDTGGEYPYGVTVGPDGLVYVATWDTVERYDPVTGVRTTLLDDPAIRPYVVDFSPDHRTLYIGTIWNGGAIWKLPLGDDLLPIGPPSVFATIGAGDEQLHDGLAVDWCGNLHVVEFYTNDLYRITPDGEVTVLVDFTETSYGHGLEWGSGIGGWRTDALYLPQPYDGNRVLELVVGVPAREWTGRPWPTD